jgi:acetyltransferase-like isoleucine patch superfamily enzyme
VALRRTSGGMPALTTPLWWVKDRDPVRLLHRARRSVLLARIRATAAWHRSSVDVDLAPDLKIGRDVRVEIAPRTANVLRIGPRSAIRDHVAIQLKGGSVVCGPETELRRNTILNVAGRLVLEEHNILSYGVVVHCAEEVVLERHVGIAELVTIADSTHYWTSPDEFFYDNVKTRPVRIGRNTWVCPRASITSGVTIGAQCLIASNSTVTCDVPDGHLASGVPATTVRSLNHAWTAS